jgi:predicted metalloprotease
MDPSVVLDQDGPVEATGPVSSSPADEETKAFVSTVVAYTEDTWTDLFQRSGQTYRAPKLVLFTGAVDSACGFARAAMGPFYCPADERVYLDMRFFQELRDRFQAPGDFAQAYVIAHEVGHHVQNLLGVTDRGSGGNEASVRLELQADCFAGVWANHNQEVLEQGDVEEGLRAASVIGDDQLQMQSQGYVVPESFTHGSAAQRTRWFTQGYQTGNPSACNTFDVANP